MTVLINLKEGEDATSKDVIIEIGKILQTVKSMYLISNVAMITYTDDIIFGMVNLVMFFSF